MEADVAHISQHGIWLFSKGQELFLPFENFPWFKEASISHILNVKEVSEDHFYWEDLDIDLTTEMIEHPKRFPLIAKTA